MTAETPVPSKLWHYLHTGDGRGCFHRVARWTPSHLFLVRACGADDGPTVKVSRTGLEETGEVKAKITTRAGKTVAATLLSPPTTEDPAALPFVWHRDGSKPCLHRVRSVSAKRLVADRACGCYETGSTASGVTVPLDTLDLGVEVTLRGAEWFYRPVAGAWAPRSTAPAYVPPKPPHTPPKARTYPRHEHVTAEYARLRAADLRALGLTTAPRDHDALRTAWRAAAKRHHPDAGGDAERFSRAREAYERLARPFAPNPTEQPAP